MLEWFEGWGAYNAACEPGREGRADMPELTDLITKDLAEDVDESRVLGYEVTFLPGGGSASPNAIGNVVGWSARSCKVAVLKRGATLQFAREAILLPEPRPGTLQAIARVLNA